ncbi:uncharacterized protein A1O9_02960 [Exophiala aquamarina CBS 119918]|uniref:Amidase domain-containing protein n=1 Tax=Exophiala aquamarina CBS 119918 TaxID=1182545 RepID=A0A072PMU1_9EURO|nr:uncharacterized protein A1O9_02960 [Exophiala aquamarina CBS 119918]KEF61394.1 hypothetical protein A1O9_02960 [Exophiala aquamarina CBS 119918]
MNSIISWRFGGRPATNHRRQLTNSPAGQQHVPEYLRVDSLRTHDIFEITVSDLAQSFERQVFSIVEYTEFCIRRISVLNPYLEAVIKINPDALTIAKALDDERVSGRPLGSLHGALLGNVVPNDAFTASMLRKAGAVIIGHANMSEWASCRSKLYSTGYSPRGGQTRNPYDLRKGPFGSSSGSAVAVAANLLPLAFGTETDTSIIGPASINGVVGIKPTVGLTSRTGVIPISENMGSVGSFGRTVADAAAGLDAICGADPEDPFTQSPDRRQNSPYSRFLSTSDVLKGARFGRPYKKCWKLTPQCCKFVALELFEALEEAGAEIIDVELPRTLGQGIRPTRHVRLDSTEGPSPNTLPAFPSGQDNLLKIIQSHGLKDETYHSALAHIHKQTRENGLDAALSGYDALMFCDRKGVGQQYAAQAGYPVICIPIGLDDNGMPVSISVQHSAWKEAELVKWSSANCLRGDISTIGFQRDKIRWNAAEAMMLKNGIPVV